MSLYGRICYLCDMKKVLYILLYLGVLVVLYFAYNFATSERAFRESCNAVKDTFGEKKIHAIDYEHNEYFVYSISETGDSFWEMRLISLDGGDCGRYLYSHGCQDTGLDLCTLVARASNDRYVLTRDRNFLHEKRPDGFPPMYDTLKYDGCRFIARPVAKWSVKSRSASFY